MNEVLNQNSYHVPYLCLYLPYPYSKIIIFIYSKTNTISKIRPDKYNDIIQDGKHTALTLMVFETELWRIKMFKLKVNSNKR